MLQHLLLPPLSITVSRQQSLTANMPYTCGSQCIRWCVWGQASSEGAFSRTRIYRLRLFGTAVFLLPRESSEAWVAQCHALQGQLTCLHGAQWILCILWPDTPAPGLHATTSRSAAIDRQLFSLEGSSWCIMQMSRRHAARSCRRWAALHRQQACTEAAKFRQIWQQSQHSQGCLTRA